MVVVDDADRLALPTPFISVREMLRNSAPYDGIKTNLKTYAMSNVFSSVYKRNVFLKMLRYSKSADVSEEITVTM